MKANGLQTVKDSKCVFDNTGNQAEARYCQSSRLYDEITIRHTEQRGTERRRSCLELSGGGGSIASWLRARVGLSGRVLAAACLGSLLALSFASVMVGQLEVRDPGVRGGHVDVGGPLASVQQTPNPGALEYFQRWSRKISGGRWCLWRRSQRPRPTIQRQFLFQLSFTTRGRRFQSEHECFPKYRAKSRDFSLQPRRCPKLSAIFHHSRWARPRSPIQVFLESGRLAQQHGGWRRA